MKSLPTLSALLLAAVISACSGSESDNDAARTTEPDPNPQVDADPTPDTGSGGDTQVKAPDATVNGAPAGDANAAKPAQ